MLPLSRVLLAAFSAILFSLPAAATYSNYYYTHNSHSGYNWNNGYCSDHDNDGGSNGGDSNNGCSECDGKLTYLELEFNGSQDSQIRVFQNKNNYDEVFNGNVAVGERFEFSGTWYYGTLGTKVDIYVDGSYATSIHTSCSEPVNPGLTFGDFEIVAAESRNGGAVCPIDGYDPDDHGDHDHNQCAAESPAIDSIEVNFDGNFLSINGHNLSDSSAPVVTLGGDALTVCDTCFNNEQIIASAPDGLPTGEYTLLVYPNADEQSCVE